RRAFWVAEVLALIAEHPTSFSGIACLAGHSRQHRPRAPGANGTGHHQGCTSCVHREAPISGYAARPPACGSGEESNPLRAKKRTANVKENLPAASRNV